jgi:hypothetical protein
VFAILFFMILVNAPELYRLDAYTSMVLFISAILVLFAIQNIRLCC